MIFPLHFFVGSKTVRSRNQVAIKEPCFEEEIIKNRGRRQMPRTPVRKSTRIESNTATISSDQPQQSPFTKCLSTIHSTPNRTDCPSPSTTTTTTRKLRSMSTIGLMKDGKIYSPNSRLLRSSVRLSESFNDSGIEMSSPSFDSSKSNTVTRTAKRKESDEIQVTPCIKRINRVRRRFRF